MDDSIKERTLKVINKISSSYIKDINLDDDNAIINLAFDSIQFVEFFAALELEFDVELPLDMMNVRNGREFLKKVENALANKAA